MILGLLSRAGLSDYDGDEVGGWIALPGSKPCQAILHVLARYGLVEAESVVALATVSARGCDRSQ